MNIDTPAVKGRAINRVRLFNFRFVNFFGEYHIGSVGFGNRARYRLITTDVTKMYVDLWRHRWAITSTPLDL